MNMSHEQKFISGCLQQKFSLPTYQRDYKWSYSQLQDLMSDVQNSFLEEWSVAHGRDNVLGYKPYFLGTIIVAPGENGELIIVDGQQRITTLFYILSYFHRYSVQNPTAEISPIDNCIRRRLAGKNTFNLKMDLQREQLFDIFLDGPADDIDFNSKIDSINSKDQGTLRIWELYQKIEQLIVPEIFKNNLIAHLVDYLTERVYLYQIGVHNESDGHKVFVTMNDRGLKLSPIDLLKGFLLAGILNSSKNVSAHHDWLDMTNRLNEIGSEEAVGFIRNWLRAKHAKTNRARKKTEEPKDFDIISSSYHRWVMDNKALLNLNNSDDYYKIISKELKFFADIYIKIKTNENKFNHKYPFLYFNGNRDLTSQAMIILSAIDVNDTEDDIDLKVQLISYYLDMISIIRFLNGKSNTYDVLRDISFRLIMEIRNKKVDEVKLIIFSKVKKIETDLIKLKEIKYEKGNRNQELLRLLARIAFFLEENMHITNSVGYETYVNRQMDHKTFDIEHIFAENFTSMNNYLNINKKVMFSNKDEFTKLRNNIGGLTLLPRGRNRSLQDALYSQKKVVYSNENILAQMMCESFYLNQPNYQRFLKSTNILGKHYDIIDKDTIKERADFYYNIASKIWSYSTLTNMFGSIQQPLNPSPVDDTE